METNIGKENHFLKKQSEKWKDFVEATRNAPNHPYMRYRFQALNGSGSKHGACRREKLFASRPFREYYKPQECIQDHNKFWQGIHEIDPITMG